MEHRLDDLRVSLSAVRQHVAGQRQAAEELRLSVERLKARARSLDIRITEGLAPIREAPKATARPRWMEAAPYLVLAAVGIAFGLRSRQSQAAPVPVLQAAAPAVEDGSETALRLVYEYRAASGRSIFELLGHQDAPMGASAWSVEREDENLYQVSYQPLGAPEPLYEFAADTASETVTPTPDTLRRLSAGAVARR